LSRGSDYKPYFSIRPGLFHINVFLVLFKKRAAEGEIA
jgi:hypothetical protein